jgi:AraC-like DNA-binding protein
MAHQDNLVHLAKVACRAALSSGRSSGISGLRPASASALGGAMNAVEWLSPGTSVGEVADRLGYEAPSASVAGFRRAFGVTPGRYFTEDG